MLSTVHSRVNSDEEGSLCFFLSSAAVRGDGSSRLHRGENSGLRAHASKTKSMEFSYTGQPYTPKALRYKRGHSSIARHEQKLIVEEREPSVCKKCGELILEQPMQEQKDQVSQVVEHAKPPACYVKRSNLNRLNTSACSLPRFKT